MSSMTIALVTFGCIFGGALLGYVSAVFTDGDIRYFSRLAGYPPAKLWQPGIAPSDDLGVSKDDDLCSAAGFSGSV